MRTSVVYKLFDKKSSGIGVESEIKYNQQLEKNYTNQLLENLKKQKVYSSFNGNIWGANLAGM